MIKVKICGITNLEDAKMVSQDGADMVGFIFSRKSPRYISERKAKKIIKQIDPFLIKAGVFLDEEKQRVLDVASFVGLDVLQFHGKETPAYCRFFKPKFKVVKVLFPQDSPYERKITGYKVDGFMFDVKYEDKIKGIKVLSSSALREISTFIKRGERIIISGGLSIDNISVIKKLKPYMVDVSSGVEKFVGRKDKKLVRRFLKAVK